MSKYYDTETESFKNIPDAPYYVLSNDISMSNWGKAKGKINTCVIPCQTIKEAQQVIAYIKTERTDQQQVRVVSRKPRAKDHVIYSLVTGWIENSKLILHARNCHYDLLEACKLALGYLNTGAISNDKKLRIKAQQAYKELEQAIAKATRK